MSQYIDKSALVAEIDKGINWRNDWQLDEYRKGYHDALTILKKYLSTLEVKEVDLEYIKEELDRLISIQKPDGDFGWGTLYNVATHFFKLGMAVGNKAQKGG